MERSEDMISPATDQIAGEPLDGFVEQYRTDLERLNYARWTIDPAAVRAHDRVRRCTG